MGAMTRGGNWLAWAAVAVWAGAIVAVSGVPAADLPPAPGGASFVAHFGEYAVLGALLFTALARSRPTARWIALTVALASLFGVSDEWHQYFVPGRQTDPLDWLCDTAGATVGALVAWAFWRRRGRGPRPPAVGPNGAQTHRPGAPPDPAPA